VRDLFLRSDLIGVVVTVAAFGVFLLTVGAFYLAGSLAGIVFAVPAWILIFYLAFRTTPSGAELSGIATIPEGARHRVLVVADEGLDHVDLVDELCRRSRAANTEVMVIAPVVASSPAHAIADDIDVEEGQAQQRVDKVVQGLSKRGVVARGHVDDEVRLPVTEIGDGSPGLPGSG